MNIKEIAKLTYLSMVGYLVNPKFGAISLSSLSQLDCPNILLILGLYFTLGI